MGIEKNPNQAGQPSKLDRASAIISGWLGPLRRSLSRRDVNKSVYANKREPVGLTQAELEAGTAPTTYQRPDTKPAPGSPEMKKSGVQAMQEVIAHNPPGFILYETAEVEKVDKTPDDIPMDDYVALNSHQDIVKGLQQFGFPTEQVGRMTRQAVRQEQTEQQLQRTHD